MFLDKHLNTQFVPHRKNNLYYKDHPLNVATKLTATQCDP